MLTFFTVVTTALIGAVAWIYQKSYDRQEFRRQSYQRVLENLPSFLESTVSAEGITRTLAEFRSMLLFAPDDVIEAAESFAESVRYGPGHEASMEKLNALVSGMRRDCTFTAALLPRLWTTKIVRTSLLNLSVSSSDKWGVGRR